MERLFEKISPFVWPLLGEEIRGFKSKNNIEIKGRAIFCPLTAKQMISNKRLRSKRVLQAIKLADKLGAKISVLGSFTSIATNDGLTLLKEKNIKTKLTTGNAFTAVVNVKNLINIVSLIKKELSNLTIAIVGAAGSMGFGMTKYLAPLTKQLILIDINSKSLKQLGEELKANGQQEKIVMGHNINLLQDADGVIVATSAPYEIITGKHLKQNTFVIDAALPHNVAKKILSHRPDIIVCNSAIVKIPGLEFNFDYGFKSGQTGGCMGEGLLLCWEGFYENFLGKVTTKQMEYMWSLSQRAKVEIAEFQNQLGDIKEDRIKEILLKTKS